MSQEGRKYFTKRARSTAISAAISTALVLYLIGLLGTIFSRISAVREYARENFQVVVFVNDSTPPAELKALYKQLSVAPFAQKVQFVSRQEAAKVLMQDWKEDFTEFLGYNPLQNSFNVLLKPEYTSATQMAAVKRYIGANAKVSEVAYQESILAQMDKNLRTVAILLGGLAAVVLLVTISLIANAVRLALFSKRFLIKSMQLVGADPKFVREPFIVQALWQGGAGALFATALLAMTLFAAESQQPELYELRANHEWWAIPLTLTLIGMLVTLASTWLAVNRYLRLRLDDLY
jgi:cell division transport system permease protein